MAEAIDILKKYWNYPSFRPLQEEIINAVLAEKDVLALLPTSAGKSICFQVPALILPGITLVISPLIALMKNQVFNLRSRGIAADALYSGMHKREIDRILDNCVYGNIKLLYISPERLKTTLFLERFKRMNVSLLAVDEAHCISEWGYDFRPPYLDIAHLKTIVPKLRVIALTASATQKVAEDIIGKLQLKEPSIFKSSFARKNLIYAVKNIADKDKKLLEVLQSISGSGIIYARSRLKTQNISRWLQSHHISADFYHAGLEIKNRNKKQDSWIQSVSQIMVATNAFGMGIDKPNVRTVLHVDIPNSLEAYYQEAGRAGRDEKKAYAVVLYQESDITKLYEQIEEAYPPLETIKKVYQSLANFLQIPIGVGAGESYVFDLDIFAKNFDLKSKEIMASLEILKQNNLLQMNDAVYQASKMQILYDNAQLYQYRIQNVHSDSFFRIVLRLYGGQIFQDYTAIKESEIAQHLNISHEKLNTLIDHLQKAKVLDYIAQHNKPTVTYLAPRSDAKNIPIDQQKINFLKSRAIKKAEAMVAYVQNTQLCRQKVLLSYFDEQNIGDCGQCDICLEKRKNQKTETKKKDALQMKVLDLLRQKEMNIEELQNIINTKETQMLAEIIQALIEDKVIIQNKFGAIYIR